MAEAPLGSFGPPLFPSADADRRESLGLQPASLPYSRPKEGGTWEPLAQPARMFVGAQTSFGDTRYAEYHCRHEHEGRRGQVHACARVAETFRRVPQERADHRFATPRPASPHAAVGDQPAPPAVGRAHDRRPAGGQRPQQRAVDWPRFVVRGVSDVDEARTST